MALWQRDVHSGQLVHHSDRGTQGGFKWSLQHLDPEVSGGVTAWLDDVGDGQGGDVFAGAATGGAAGASAAVLGGDRPRVIE